MALFIRLQARRVGKVYAVYGRDDHGEVVFGITQRCGTTWCYVAADWAGGWRITAPTLKRIVSDASVVHTMRLERASKRGS